MNKKITAGLILGILLVLSGCSSDPGTGSQNASQNAGQSLNDKLIFFYGDTCPHCKKVEEFFAQNKVTEKISFSQKEVYNNKDNGALLSEKAAECGLKQDEIGVPLLWDNGKCLTGDVDIIDYFNKKINEKK
jgi:glutaredoxin